MKTKHKIALAWMAKRGVQLVRGVCGQPMEGEFVRRGVKWHLDLNEGIDFSIYLLGVFEEDVHQLCKKYVKPGDTILDIGANIGAHTLQLARLTGPRGRVLAFEPTDFAYRKNRRNLDLNPELAAHVQLSQTLLVAESDVAAAVKPAGIYSSWPLDTKEGTHEQHLGVLQSLDNAGLSTLDNIIDQSGVTRVDFVKMDVDGNEPSVLRGARRTFAKWKPRILMEVAPYVLEEQGWKLEDLLSILRELNYTMRHASSGAVIPLDAEQISKSIAVGESINVIAE